jgi:hypothetical protein
VNGAKVETGTGVDGRHHPRMSVEQELWVVVVQQAVQEAVVLFGSENIRSRRAARDAWEWMFHPKHDRDFWYVCHMAGLSPGWVRDQVRRYWTTKDFRFSAVPNASDLRPWELVCQEAA